MRFLPWLLLTLCTTYASAQSATTHLLEQGLQQVAAGFAPVPAKDKADILAATATLLAKHITFRPDGTASAYYTSSGRRPVEWKKFVVSRISDQAVTEADRLNGITKRYLVSFGCNAHRNWDSKTNTWGQWQPIGNVTFPAGIYFEWKNNAWTARESSQLKFFTPGPGPSINEPKRTGKDAGLPSGMTRGK
ncbi:MAG: hypothetical protein WCS43_03545 [Verrucomicrobiota bacterium]